MKRLNDMFAEWLSRELSKMRSFWILTVLILGTLIWQRPSGAQGWILFGVSVFFQGVALVIINYTTDKASNRQEKILLETHDGVMQEISIMKEDLALAKQDRTETHELLKEVHALLHYMHVPEDKEASQ